MLQQGWGDDARVGIGIGIGNVYYNCAVDNIVYSSQIFPILSQSSTWPPWAYYTVSGATDACIQHNVIL